MHDTTYQAIKRKISRILIKERRQLSLKEICEQLADFKHVDEDYLRRLLTQNNGHFQVDVLVKLVTKVDICKTYCTKGKTCTGSLPGCTGLHICKFFFLSGKCEYGEFCTFGHSLDQEHNRNVLKKNLLDDITVEDLKYLLRLSHNRTVFTVPRICKFYHFNTCKHGTRCSDLHICRHFLKNDCNYHTRCWNSHNLKDEGNTEVLRKHGMDVSKSNEELVKELRDVLLNIESAKGCGDELKQTDKAEEAGSVFGELQQPLDPTGNLHDTCIKAEVKVEEDSQECTITDQSLHAPVLRTSVTSEFVHFRYMSEITASEKRSKGNYTKSDATGRNSLVDIWVDNYSGGTTIVAYCVDSYNNVHPYNLYGENCTSGVYLSKRTLEPDQPVQLHGVSICTPKIQDYSDNSEKSIAFLYQNGITGLQACDGVSDRNLVYLRVAAVLEDGSILHWTTPVLRNRKNLRKHEDLRKKRELESGFEQISKRRKQQLHTSSYQITDETLKPFDRLYSRVSTSGQWGNFIDTTGYEESALTWKAQGDALRSVCMICYPGGTGTGFRVGLGKNYIITAGHVYNFIVNSGQNGVGRQHRNPLRSEEVFAVFDYLKEGNITRKNKFYFTGKLLFRNDAIDTVVLELCDSSRGIPMPPAFQYFQKVDFTGEFYFVGHSEGKPLAINKIHKIVNIRSSEAQTDIQNIRKFSLEHTKCLDYPCGRDYESPPYQTLDNQHRFLFHCKFTKGASGSPGLVFMNDGRIVVVSMLLCGYPDWYYDPNPNMNDKRSNWLKDEWCVEQGVNIESVFNFMKKENPSLANEIFCNEQN